MSDDNPSDSGRTFEEALANLEILVDRLEKGDLSLEESLKDFEQGIKLTRACQQILREAEHRVHILTASSPDAELEDFKPHE